MSAETPTNPYSAFENMTDEEVVAKAKECAGSGIPAAQIP